MSKFSQSAYERVGLGGAIREAEKQYRQERSGDNADLPKTHALTDSIGDMPVQKRLAGITRYERGAVPSSGCMPLNNTHVRGMLDESNMTDLKALGIVPRLPRLFEDAVDPSPLLREWEHREGKAVLSMMSRLKMVYEAQDSAAISKTLYDLRTLLADLDDEVDDLETESVDDGEDPLDYWEGLGASGQRKLLKSFEMGEILAPSLVGKTRAQLGKTGAEAVAAIVKKARGKVAAESRGRAPRAVAGSYLRHR